MNNAISLDSSVPYFQPILTAEDQSIYGFEVLGRYIENGEVKSLGAFFNNPAISDQYKQVVDESIREKAFAEYVRCGSTCKLFINIKPSWIYRAKKIDKFPTLTLLEKYKIDPHNLVIEVTEDELLGDLDLFSQLVLKYRQAGCLLAIDDFGRFGSNVERIAIVQPDIIKIDKSIVQNIASHQSFFEVSNAMAMFGTISGFDILFEGIETPFELERCIEARGLFYQGYIFSQPLATMKEDVNNKDLFSDIIGIARFKRLNFMEKRCSILQQLDLTIEKNINDILSIFLLDEQKQNFETFIKKLPGYSIGFYCCNREAMRITNYFRILDNGISITDTKKDLLFSKVFTDALSHLQSGHKSCISVQYKTVALKEGLSTYIYKISDSLFVCIDIMMDI